ncbi:MAG TPA: lysophospholipid acyltransferase family protein, partial [Gemmatimonadaceae bacterium]|nr:lysophospholipid acyltransferase family protein [Gemmatimonadaceae bacterium]
MLYRLLHWIAGVALDWFYGDVEVVGAERVPDDAPLLLAANHPNQLIDALLVARAVPRRVTFTGKAVLMKNPVVAVLARSIGFVPLQRVQDVRAARTDAAPPQPLDPSRNAAAFDAIIDALDRRAAVLIFPEGISHDRPELAPVKTGVARIALQARDARGVRDLHVVPVGLTFERKWAARTRVLVQVGEPLAMDDWRPSAGAAADSPAAVAELTAEVERRLRAVTLNFPSREAADAVMPAAHLLAALLEGEPR